jgi:CRP-like cAMP-binding protein
MKRSSQHERLDSVRLSRFAPDYGGSRIALTEPAASSSDRTEMLMTPSRRSTLLRSLFTAPVRQIGPGTRLFSAGEPAHNLFFLATGMVKLTEVSITGDERIVRLYQRGEIFGESCFLQAAQLYGATALEQSEVLQMSARRVIDQLQSRPDILQELLGEMSSRLAATNGEFQAFLSDKVVVRLGARLLALVAALESESDWLDLPHGFRHQDLAQLMGVQRETVTRAIAALRRLDLVTTVGRGALRIHRTKMRRFLASDATIRRIGPHATSNLAAMSP